METSIRSQFVVPAVLLSTISLSEQDLAEPDRVLTRLTAQLGMSWPPPTYEEFLADIDRKRRAFHDQMFECLPPVGRQPMVMPPEGIHDLLGSRRKPFRSTGSRRMIGF